MRRPGAGEDRLKARLPAVHSGPWKSKLTTRQQLMQSYVAVGQKSWTKILILGGHNRHFYMILQVRYVASRKEIPQNTS